MTRRNIKGCRLSWALLLFLPVCKKFLECYSPLFHKFCQVEWFKRCSGFSHILEEVCDKLTEVYSLVKHLVASFPPEDSSVLTWLFLFWLGVLGHTQLPSSLSFSGLILQLLFTFNSSGTSWRSSVHSRCFSADYDKGCWKRTSCSVWSQKHFCFQLTTGAVK